jgi:radical SAM-linked protein
MTDPNQTAKYRLRLTFAKKIQVKYISHLDLALAWERALRRAQIPLAYSQGFNPRPKMQFASSLPLGTISRAEIVDIIVTEPVALSAAMAQIKVVLPTGIELLTVAEVPLKTPALQSLLHQADYRVTVETEISAERLTRRIETLLAAEKIIQTRRRKQQDEEFDLRPWLYDLRLDSAAGGEACLHMRLAAGQSGNLRPVDVLKALDLADNWTEVERIRLIFADA